jgi:hypothetical protein
MPPRKSRWKLDAGFWRTTSTFTPSGRSLVSSRTFRRKYSGNATSLTFDPVTLGPKADSSFKEVRAWAALNVSVSLLVGRCCKFPCTGRCWLLKYSTTAQITISKNGNHKLVDRPLRIFSLSFAIESRCDQLRASDFAPLQISFKTGCVTNSRINYQNILIIRIFKMWGVLLPSPAHIDSRTSAWKP